MPSEVRVPRLLRVSELAALTGLPRWRIYELLQQGKGPPHLRIGKTFRFPEGKVMTWIDEQSTSTSKER